MINILTRSFSAFLIFTLLSSVSIAQSTDFSAGKALFKANCAACHNKDMKSKLTGPALGGAKEAWAEYPAEDLYNWVRNSQAMINAGHPRAVELWNEWQPTVMTNFPNLTDQDIDEIFKYVDGVVSGEALPKVAETPGGSVVEEAPRDYTWLYLTLFFVLAIMAIVLSKVITNLNALNEAKAKGIVPPAPKSIGQILTSRPVVSFAIFAIVVLGGYTAATKSVNLGRQMNYAPEQPIKYSHLTHAGMHQIDCNYCHDGARRSMHASIPAANTCMNCHTAIKIGSKYGAAELTKIYASIGFDPNTGKYIDDYGNMSNTEIEKIYKKWLETAYVELNEGLGVSGEREVREQWKGVVKALTGPGDDKIQGPINWVRIHKLPDHVYFNHAQHVSVGKLECQECHGKIEEMEVVKQQTPLSMGWCINCHRETEVNFANNEYYDHYYENYHNEIKEGTRKGVTVEDIGGIGCQRCHY